ncbi:MAG: carbohydrate ABC transporter permease [Massiliimalia sp.]|jgi:multiple sugar transport system permease protein
MRLRLRTKKSLTGILFLLPFLVGFLYFFLIPFFISIGYTFTSGIGGMEFAGLTNYREVLQSSAFRLAAGNTFRFLLVGIPLIMALSLGVSLLLQKRFAGSRIFRGVFLYPMVVPIASTVMFFQVMFEDQGVLNSILEQLGVSPVSWLHSSSAFSVLVGLYLWKNCGYNMVLFLTGLNSIPSDYREAADLEGCSSAQYFRYVTLPLLVPSFLFVFLMSIINSFKIFREAFLLGGAYPDNSIYMLQHFMNNNFQNLNYQRLSVAALLTFFFIFLMVVGLFVLKYRSDRKGGGQG